MKIEAGNRLSITAEFLAELEDRRSPVSFIGGFIGWDEPNSRLLIAEQPDPSVGEFVLLSCHSAAGGNFGESLFQRAIVENMRAAYLDEVTVLRRLAFNVINKNGGYSHAAKDDESKLEFLRDVAKSSERGRNMWSYTDKEDGKWMMFIANTGILVESAVRGDIRIANDALLENYTADYGEMSVIYARSRAYILKLKNEFAVNKDNS